MAETRRFRFSVSTLTSEPLPAFPDVTVVEQDAHGSHIYYSILTSTTTANRISRLGFSIDRDRSPGPEPRVKDALLTGLYLAPAVVAMLGHAARESGKTRSELANEILSRGLKVSDDTDPAVTLADHRAANAQSRAGAIEK